MEQYRKNPKLEVGYDVTDPAFQTLLQCMMLGSKAAFSYTPTTEEIKRFVARQKNEKVRNWNRYEITQSEKEEGL